MADGRADAANDEAADNGLQDAPVHRGGGPAPTYDTNEKADEKVEVLQPNGESVPTAEEDAPGRVL